jgi:hypothetical protein
MDRKTEKPSKEGEISAHNLKRTNQIGSHWLMFCFSVQHPSRQMARAEIKCHVISHTNHIFVKSNRYEHGIVKIPIKENINITTLSIDRLKKENPTVIVPR